MTQHRRQHRLQDTRVNIAGSRSKQGSVRELQFVEIVIQVNIPSSHDWRVMQHSDESAMERAIGQNPMCTICLFRPRKPVAVF
jgi:hypothetical protein